MSVGAREMLRCAFGIAEAAAGEANYRVNVMVERGKMMDALNNNAALVERFA